MIEITHRPTATISGETSKWNAVGNPVVYKLQRLDLEFDQVNNDGGNVSLQFIGVDVTSLLVPGDIVYFESDDGTYEGTAEVLTSVFVTDTDVALDFPYTISALTGFVNNDVNVPGYRVNINVYNSVGDLLNESPFEYSPDPTGLIVADVSAILKVNISPDNEYTPVTDFNQTDTNAYIAFYIEYLETWEGDTGSMIYETDEANILYAVFGSRQIPAPYGGNLAEYVTWNDLTPLADFLTKFMGDIVVWRDWPYWISWITGSISVVYAVNLKIGAQSISGGTETAQDKLSLANIGRRITDLIASLGGYNGEAITFWAFRNVSSAELTVIRSIELRDACKNPVMLQGRNSLGGVLMWLFETTQDYSYDYKDGRKARRMVLYTDGLTLNQWECLHDFITLGQVYKDNILELTSSTIKTSTRVGQQVYVVAQDGTKTGVIVIPTRNQTRTRRYRHDFEIEIEFPEQFEV